MKRHTLVLVLMEARALVERPGNRFGWSSWASSEWALRELESTMMQLLSERATASLHTLFAPTGPLQDLALSSGWSEEFRVLTERYERACDQSTPECSCLTPPFHYTAFESTSVGCDVTAGRYADVSIERCCRCGQPYLRYFYEYEAFSGSGRWFRAPLSADAARDLVVESAVTWLGRAPFHFLGGSYFESTGRRLDFSLNTAVL